MPRPQRIQYENAFYHVMNRGRARQTIFHDADYFHAFLDTLEEAHTRFDAVIHAYCLMSNHYHLLIETPRANLDRIMRHINGVYTQRHNRLKRTDGPLFRGRYKAILVDKDAYLLQLSRYIHRNPIEVKRHIVADLAQYPWSSYPAYINQCKAHAWLNRETTYGLLGKKHKYIGYRNYVMQGLDEEVKQFYSRGNYASVIGVKEFKESIASRKGELMIDADLSKVLNLRPSAQQIVEAVSQVYGVDKSVILVRKAGRQVRNDARNLSMYMCQQYGDMSLREIADTFGLRATSSVSPAIANVKKKLVDDESELNRILKYLNYIK